MDKHMSYDEMRKIWGQITARAWEDNQFKERLKAHPEEVLKEYGMPIRSGVHYKVHEDDKMVTHFVLRQKPEGLSSADLKKLAAAGGLLGNSTI